MVFGVMVLYVVGIASQLPLVEDPPSDQLRVPQRIVPTIDGVNGKLIPFDLAEFCDNRFLSWCTKLDRPLSLGNEMKSCDEFKILRAEASKCLYDTLDDR